MAEYQRFVAYIYEYINGRKNRNAGFAKVEIRNGICRIQVHIQDVMAPDGKIKIFGFVRQAEKLPAVLLGEGLASQGRLERRITTPEETVGGSSFSFGQLGGICIKSESGRSWATVFDDDPIDVGRIGEAEEVSQAVSRKPEEVLQMPREEAAEAVTQVVLEESEEVSQTPREEVAEAVTQVVSKEPEEVSQTLREEVAEEVMRVVSEEPKEVSQTLREEISEPVTQVVSREPEEVSQMPQEEISESAIQPVKEEVASVVQEELEEVSKEQSPEPPRMSEKEKTDRRWQCITAKYPHFQPLSDGSLEDAIRIRPSDLRTLWQKGWRQGSNSFLMHGYYQYRYLMLGKCKDGGYVLGVPGIQDEQEQYMARMFGFPEFRPAANQQGNVLFGYWCRPMN